MTFLKKLEAVCPKCKASSIRLYLQNVKRLYRFVDSDAEDIPATGEWMKRPILLKKLDDIPVNKRRHLSLSGLKAARAYKLSEKVVDQWYAQMISDAAAYQKKRDTNQASDYEKKMLPKRGMVALRKAAVEIKRRLKFILDKEPSLKSLYKYQFFIASKLLASQIAFRNDLATIQVTESKTHNVLVTPPKGNFQFVMRDYKSSDRLGEKTIKINRANTMALRKFLAYRKGLVKHDYLFTGYDGRVMTKAAFGKALQKIYETTLGKRIGTRLIRVLWANENKVLIRESADLSNRMLHSQKQTGQYIKE